MTKQGLKLTAICLAVIGCTIILDYLVQPLFRSIPSDKRIIVDAVLTIFVYIGFYLEIRFIPFRKLYRILKKKRVLIKRAENK